MKTLATLTLLSISLLAAPHAARAQLSIPDDPAAKVFMKANALPFYDASKDETGVSMTPYWLTGSSANHPVYSSTAIDLGVLLPNEGVKFAAYFTYPGKTYAAPRQIMLKLSSTKRGGRRFSDGDKLSVVVDGQSLGVGDTAITLLKYKAAIPKPNTEYVDEVVNAPLSLEDFNRLAAAKKVELRVGAESWKLGQTPLKAVRRLAEAIGEAK
ncbi:MAG TPA: hypothetical protein VGP08_09965 [Pyrinomonadaceae bacterium]|jgi:hypothetical protein|nr:hypothetical protein [Pyrinomonadaceae bacterium]